MSVSLDEQRFSRTHVDAEPDFIELPAARPARGRLKRRQPGPSGAGQRELSPPRLRIRVDIQQEIAHRLHGEREPRWVRILVGLFTFERSTGYAISIFVHMLLIIFFALFLLRGSAPTPTVVIESSFQEETASFSELRADSLTLPEAANFHVPIAGDVESPHGDGLGRFFGDEGADFFGLRVGGRDIVYIVDCSGSIQGPPLLRAKQELLDSMAELQPDQRVYVIFFSNTPYLMFNQSGPPTELMRATAENRGKIRDWVQRLPAGGGTFPEQSLKWAIGLNPDAVFLLSDGKFDDIIEEITRANDGTCRIHTIAFMNSSGEELLRRIADENGGTYRFVPYDE